MYKEITACRACGWGSNSYAPGTKNAGPTEQLVPVLDLGVQPLANDFRKPGEERAGFAPLKVMYCPRCTLAQLSVVVKPEILYSFYPYRTSPSNTLRHHFQSLLSDIRTEIEPGSVIEIGSNDGIFLAFLSDNGFGNLVGIDPAKNLAAEAHAAGILTVNDFLNLDSAKAASSSSGNPSLIMARHVFCHAADWVGFFRAMDVMASKDTLICIEAPYVVDQINIGSFDQIYHEHLSYLTIRAVKMLLNETPFHLHRVCHYPIHGGTVLLMIRRNDCSQTPSSTVEKYLEKECVSLEFWRNFSTESHRRINELGQTVRDLVSQGRRVCGYGASAKSTVWITAAKLTRKEIQFICDCTREKVYCLSPGDSIPIVHEGMHVQDCIDYAIMFAWNYAQELIDREKQFKDLGGKWIIPIPELRIV